LDDQHKKWIATTNVSCLELSTEEGISLDENIQKIRDFIEKLRQM